MKSATSIEGSAWSSGKPPQESFRQRHVRIGRNRFGVRQPLDRDHRCAARQRLSNALHEGIGLITCQDELPPLTAVLIDHTLDMPQEPRRVLHLVNHHRRRVLS